jgi:tetratricopeptide (TPR) repeat protein
MKEKRQTKRGLERIKLLDNPEQLNSYRDPALWNELSVDERELLALLFVKQGAQQLATHPIDRVPSFDIAARLAPSSGDVWLQTALALINHSSDPTTLALAHEKLTKAHTLSPNLIEAWQLDADVLTSLGEHYEEIGYLKEAERCLQQAFTLLPQDGSTPPSNLITLAGNCWLQMGRLSGEAYDFWKAIEYYRSALAQTSDQAELWDHYGQAVEALGRLVGKPDMLQEAVDSYCKALAADPKQVETHIHLANLNLRLFLDQGSPTAFSQSSQGFQTALQLDPRQAEAWLGWAMLLASQAERHRDLEALKESIDKFRKADECEPHHSVILSSWGEALATLGAVTENLHLLREGTAKVIKALEIEPDCPATWRSYASCLVEFGHYFNEESYFLDALEKIKIGLRHDDTVPSLWAVLARIYTALGTLRGDVPTLEEALTYFEKANQLYSIEVPSLYNEWGVCLLRLTEATSERRYVEEAVAKFQKSIQGLDESPDGSIEPEWLYNYGCALDFLGDHSDNPMHYEKAIQVLSHTLQLDPTYRHARYNLALAWCHLGELTTEVEFLEKAIELFEEIVQDDDEDEMAWNELALTLLSLSQLVKDPIHSEKAELLLVEAETYLLRALSLGNSHAAYNIACLYSLQGKYDSALHFLERADATQALPPLEELLNDDWLQGVRQTEAFRQFYNQLTYRRSK